MKRDEPRESRAHQPSATAEEANSSLLAERARARLLYRAMLLRRADTAMEQAYEFALQAAGGDETKACRLLGEWALRKDRSVE